MLFSEIIAVCSQIHTKHTNTLCGHNAGLLNVTPNGTYSYHWAFIRRSPACPDYSGTRSLWLPYCRHIPPQPKYHVESSPLGFWDVTSCCLVDISFLLPVSKASHQ
jgi:hypothetical protein